MTNQALSKNFTPRRQRLLCMAAFVLGLGVSGGTSGEEVSVRISSTQPNVVSYWNEVANRTVNASSVINTTAEEQRPSYHVDLATLHVAIYDAISAIDRRYEPFAVTPTASSAGASLDAAASAAAYGVLRALFPNRGAQYQAAYDSRIAAIPAGDARTKGLALGHEVAAAVVALRAEDGRSIGLAPYVSSTIPGRFRSASPTPFNRHVPFIRTFSLASTDQFRPPGPPPLASAAYASAFNQIKSVGGTVSTGRMAEQFEIARFHTEPPNLFVTRNLGRFASSTADVGDAARLMAFIYVVHADAIGACFDAKYFHETWRPLDAIALADTDGNPETVGDAAWTPVLPTPNHPEYPAAHSCTSGALGETLRHYYGTRQVSYSFDSAVTGTTRTYATTDALNDESRIARVYGGMHFDFSTVAGVELGVRVAEWVAAHHFGRRE
jgi:hypothetical protein